MSEREKFEFLHNQDIDEKVYLYLEKTLNNLSINVIGKYTGNVFELMAHRYLEGWCWQTTESSIVFFKDNDYIARGYLYLEDNKKYYHSWIVFEYNNNNYVFDPCLSFINKKEDYYKLFNVETLGTVKSYIVKEELLKQAYLNNKEFEIIGKEDVNAPIYRNNSSYVLKQNNNKIKKLRAHYHYNA